MKSKMTKLVDYGLNTEVREGRIPLEDGIVVPFGELDV